MDENEEYFQRQASHRQSRRRFRKINQKGERQTIIDTVDPYPTGKPPAARGYHTVSLGCSCLFPPSLHCCCWEEQSRGSALLCFAVVAASPEALVHFFLASDPQSRVPDPCRTLPAQSCCVLTSWLSWLSWLSWFEGTRVFTRSASGFFFVVCFCTFTPLC